MLIKGKVKKVFFSNDTFIAGAFIPDSDKDFKPVVVSSSKNGQYKFSGQHMLGDGDHTNSSVKLYGEWVNDKKYGWGLNCSSIELDVKDDLHYFLVSYIHGIGEAKAKKLLNDFGSDRLIDMIENRPHELTMLKGIGEKLKKKIVTSWNKFKSIKRLGELLLPAGCTPGMVQKIYRHFDSDESLVDDIRENPYMLMVVPGISFKFADSIGLHLGFSEDSPVRIKAAVMHTIECASLYNGDTLHSINELFDVFHKDMGILVSMDTWLGYIDQLVDEKIVVRGNGNYVCLESHYAAESYIHKFLVKRLNMKCAPALDSRELKHLIAKLENQQGFHYNAEQRSAIEAANVSMIQIISGSAGTGKTTVSKGVLEVLTKNCSRNEVFVTALSGIATDRIRRATGFNGGTIQSLLVQGSAAFDFKVIAIDESSMIHSEPMAQLLKRIPDDCRVVLIGDHCQIYPVGPGSVFSDVINSRSFPVANLTEPNRQSAQSQIISVANDIRKGVYPTDLNVPQGDFKFIEHFIPNYRNLRNKLTEEDLFKKRSELYDQIRESISEIYQNWKSKLDEYYVSGDLYSYIYSLQLITPIKKGPLGVVALNDMAQKILNFRTETIKCNTGELGLRDKVVHLKNKDMPSMSIDEYRYNKNGYDANSKERIFNGFIGIVMEIDFEEELVWVCYPTDERVVIYEFEQVQDLLQLAYSLTIHKSQGSEYDTVICPICNSFYRMLNNTLMYTAVTRSKEMAYLIGDPYSLQLAVKNKDSSKRRTVLQRLLKQSFSGGMHV